MRASSEADSKCFISGHAPHRCNAALSRGAGGHGRSDGHAIRWDARSLWRAECRHVDRSTGFPRAEERNGTDFFRLNDLHLEQRGPLRHAYLREPLRIVMELDVRVIILAERGSGGECEKNENLAHACSTPLGLNCNAVF